MELQIATQGGRRRGAGRKLTEDEVPVDVRERLVIAKADREEALARKAEIELLKLRGTVLDKGDILSSRVRQMGAFKARMRAIPSTFCGQFVAPNRLAEAFDVLTQMIDEALGELADADR